MSGDGFDAVLAEMDKAFGMVACNGSVADPVCNEMKRRLSAAHAAEVGERDARIERYMLLSGQLVKLLDSEGVKLPDGFTVETAAVRFAEELAERRVRADAAESRADRAMGLLREVTDAIYSRWQATDPVITELLPKLQALLAEQAQVGGENGK